MWVFVVGVLDGLGICWRGQLLTLEKKLLQRERRLVNLVDIYVYIYYFSNEKVLKDNRMFIDLKIRRLLFGQSCQRVLGRIQKKKVAEDIEKCLDKVRLEESRFYTIGKKKLLLF
eukprot:TRINITY_DN17495_c0_g2_i2.p2 TRINITY_DN17495_c0_g2~~TRINITY_DN17495_c0_g2_i2.p2  ORF type:complete len:115 (-),score=14.58 TRINITY_DN17495_c0_g2_i2:31-375(-)